MNERRVSWQECHVCGGVMVWRDADAPPVHEHASVRIEAEWFVNREGSAPVNGAFIRCSECGTTDYYGLHRAQRRWGERLPG